MNLQPVLTRPVVMVLGVLGLLLALDLFALGAARSLDQANIELEDESRTRGLIAELPPVILAMQSGMRGYLLTGRKEELAQYRSASNRFPSALEQALQRVDSTDTMRALLEDARGLTARWLETRLSPLVVKRNAGEGSLASMKGIVQALKAGHGDPLAARILATLDAALAEQDKRIALARERVQAQSQDVSGWMRARAVGLVLTMAALALLLGRTLMRLTGQTSSREAAERTARESSASLRAMNDASPLGMFVADTDGACTLANAAFERITNLSGQSLRGAGWQEALHPDDRERVQAAWKASIRQQAPFQSEHRFLHRNGNVVWVAIKSAPIRDGSKPIGHVCTVEDVSERRNAEEALRRSEERLQLVLEVSQLALFDWHVPSGEIVLSRQWLVLAGHQQDSAETTARRFAEILHPEDREPLREAVISAFKGRRAAFIAEFRVRSQSGQWRRLRAQGRVTERDPVGRAVQLTGTLAAAG